MPSTELDEKDIKLLRTQIQQLAEQVRALDAELSQLERDFTRLQALHRAGTVSTLQFQVAQRRLVQRKAARDEALQRGKALDKALADLLRELEKRKQQRRHEAAAQAMDGSRPIALFPVRLETRYRSSPQALQVRVYPDTLHVVRDAEGLTDAEREAGMALWQARFAQQGAAEAERDLVQALGRGRARWIVRALTPTNAAQAGTPGASAQFPEVPAIDARARATRALLLPARWCAIGYAAHPQQGPRVEVFRVWGEAIPEDLPMSPDWQNLADQAQGLFDGAQRWMVDFDAALAKGMALQITQQQVTASWFRLDRDPLARLLVVGLAGGQDAAQGAADVAALLAAHRDGQGLGFVAPGTPTNNTEAAPSGHSPADEHRPAEAEAPAPRDALQLLCHALGIAEDALDAEGIANTGLRDQRTALHMVNVLWRGTVGNYLVSLWNREDLGEAGMYLKPATVNALRKYAVTHLRPAGPLPVLRVGKQPYGLLPVVGRTYSEDGASAVEQGISRLLGFLRPMWELAAREVPLLDGGDLDKAKDILQTAPWSQVAYYRDEPPGGQSNVTLPFGTQQNMVARRLFQMFGATNFDSTHIVQRQFMPDPPYKPGPLAGVPWVLADAEEPAREAPADSPLPPGDGNYLARMAQVLGASPKAANALLKQYQGGPALLQSLAAFSVDLERTDAAETVASGSIYVDKVTGHRADRMVDIDPGLPVTGRTEVRTPQQLEQVVLPDVTGRLTLGDFVVQGLAAPRADAQGGGAARAPAFTSMPITSEAARLFDSAAASYLRPFRDMAAVRDSLNDLATRPVGELNTALRSTLDAFSYRLDAWYTARASRRLALVRGRQAGGLYLGGFGWVEQLRPPLPSDQRPASEGHVLAPSLAQAATAAILRSGAIANRESGAFGIQLDSTRTRGAQEILQGLTRDQPLAALYGYRIERGLRDAMLGRLILPLRKAFPWRPAGEQPSDEPAEAVAARDVVDGVALLAAWQAAPGSALPGVTASVMPTVGQVLQPVADLADAVADLLMAEGMYQIVQGNFERAGAAMGVVDKQAMPIAPEVARTPRGGVAYTQRFAVLCPLDAGSAWPSDRRARAEPALEAWLAHMLGAPTRWQIAARVYRGDAMDAQPLVLGLQALGWSALSVVLGATDVDGTAQARAQAADTGLRARLVQALAQQLADAASATGLDILPDGATPGAPGLGALEALCTTLRAVLDHLRPATRKDLVVPDDPIEQTLPDEGEYPGVDLAELQARAAGLRAEFVAARDALAASADADALLAQLAALEDFLPAAAWPPQVAAIDAPSADPATRSARAATAREALRALLQDRLDALDPPPAEGAPTPTHGQQVQRALDQIRLLLGRGFPVLPRFRLGAYAPDFNRSLEQQGALTQDDPWAVTGWMAGMARVREGLDRFAGALSAHEALVDFSAAGDFLVVQYPRTAVPVWAALPEAWKAADAAAALDQVPEELRAFVAAEGKGWPNFHRSKPSLALALHTPGGRTPLQADTALAGFVCDEWPEAVPDRFQTAGIAFHHDAPGARPPQTILLAVPPHAQQPHWEFDQVLDTVHEAFDLARLRAVRPRDLGSGLGELLPANYLPENYTDALPSVRLLQQRREAWRRLLDKPLTAQLSVDGANAVRFARGKI